MEWEGQVRRAVRCSALVPSLAHDNSLQLGIFAGVERRLLLPVDHQRNEMAVEASICCSVRVSQRGESDALLQLRQGCLGQQNHDCWIPDMASQAEATLLTTGNSGIGSSTQVGPEHCPSEDSEPA